LTEVNLTRLILRALRPETIRDVPGPGPEPTAGSASGTVTISPLRSIATG